MPKYIRFNPTEEQLAFHDTTMLAGLTHIYHLGCVDVHGKYDEDEDEMIEGSIDPTKILAAEALIDILVEKDLENAEKIGAQSVSTLMAWMNYGPHVLYEDRSYQIIVPIENICPQMLEKTAVLYEYLENIPETIAV